MTNPIQQQLKQFDDTFDVYAFEFPRIKGEIKDFLSYSMELAYKAGLEASVIGEGHMKAWKKIAREETLREVKYKLQEIVNGIEGTKNYNLITFINNLTK